MARFSPINHLIVQMDPSIHKKDWSSSQIRSHVQMLANQIQSLIVPTTIFHARVRFHSICIMNIYLPSHIPPHTQPTTTLLYYYSLLPEHSYSTQNPLCLLQLLRDVKNMKRAILEEESSFDMVLLAARLSEVGYRLHLRSALGGGDGINAFHNLRNEFLIVAGEGESEGIDFIVEVRFKEHFEIPYPTDRYAAIMQSTPEEVVTSAANLTPLVHLLSSELSIAFNAKELSLPPWRQAKSLLSKWLPSKSKDVDMSTPSGSPRAGSPSVCCGMSSASPGSQGWLTPRTLSMVTPKAVDTVDGVAAASNGIPLHEKDDCITTTTIAAAAPTTTPSSTTTTTTIEKHNGNIVLVSPFHNHKAPIAHLSPLSSRPIVSEERAPSTPVGGKPRSLLSIDLQAKASSSSTSASTPHTNSTGMLTSTNSKSILGAHRLAKSSSNSAAVAVKGKNGDGSNGPLIGGWEEENAPPIRRVRMQGQVDTTSNVVATGGTASNPQCVVAFD